MGSDQMLLTAANNDAGRENSGILHNTVHYIRASVDALCRDGPGQISRERVQRGRLTRQGTTS